MLQSKPAKWPPLPGSQCLVSNSQFTMRELPTGLENGSKARWMGLDPENPTFALIQTQEGTIYSLAHNQYDVPRVWEVGGRWLPECDPRLLDHLEDELERANLEKWQEPMDSEQQFFIASLETRLRRHGRL